MRLLPIGRPAKLRPRVVAAGDSTEGPEVHRFLLDGQFEEMLRPLEVPGAEPFIEAGPALHREIVHAALALRARGSDGRSRSVHLDEQGTSRLRRDLADQAWQFGVRECKPVRPAPGTRDAIDHRQIGTPTVVSRS